MYKFLCFFLFLPLFGCSLKSEYSFSNTGDFHVFEAKNGFSIDFYSGPTTAREIQSQKKWVVLNGSYFWLTKSWTPYPAGLWIKNGWTFFPLDTTDPNLSFVVSLSGSVLEIRKNSESKDQIPACQENTSGCFAFQAWPLVLSGNLLQDFWESWHAYGKYERTLIGRTQSGRIFFFVFSEKTSLTDAAQDILKNNIFQKDPLTLLNLDGWPSTSYRDDINEFHPDEKLPIFIHIP